MLPILLALTLARAPMPGPCPAKPGEFRVGVYVGTQRVFKVPGLRGIALTGKPDIADVRMIGDDSVLVIGGKEGRATLAVFGTEGRREYRVDVTVADSFCGISEAAKFFACDTTLEQRMVGDRIYLEGTADSIADWKAVRLLKQNYTNVVSFVKLNPRFADRAVHDANLALHRAGFDRARVVVAGTKALLEGDVTEGNEKQVRALAEPWLAWIESLLSVEAPEPKWMPAQVGPEDDGAPASAVARN